MNSFGFAAHELRQLRALKTPAGIQKFLDDLPYNLSYTALSPKKVLHDRTASCLEGGIFGAAALRVIGFSKFADIGVQWRNPISPDAVIASRCIAACANWP